MICPTCGAAELVHDVRDVPYTYKGETTVIPVVAGDFCPACNEIVHDKEDGRRVMDAMRAFNREVNAQITDPSYIREVRTKLHLNQQEAGALFGGGVNAFSRYETGKAKPSLALVQLFKLLDKNPQLLEQLR